MDASTDVCVIGGGPAGSVLGARLAQLGHRVCLVEAQPFPRARLGESLSAGVLPLLARVGAAPAIAAAGFSRIHKVDVAWENGPQPRVDPAAQGLLVDRARFDQLLLDHARACGVRVLQPARAARVERTASGWDVRLQGHADISKLRARFVADASGRSGGLQHRRRRTGERTIALHAYWRGIGLPVQPRIEAGASAWYWGVPLPDGTYNTLIFAAPGVARIANFAALLGRSGLLAGSSACTRIGPVRAADATSYLAEEAVTPDSIKVGDAALALDPLSSSGVQRAIQSALAGAVVVNTLLRQPQSRAAALAFYRDHLRATSERHTAWAAERYAAVAAQRREPFWQDRGAAAPLPATTETPAQLAPRPDTRLVVSPGLAISAVPCLGEAFVEIQPAIHHRSLAEPVAYVGRWQLAPLLQVLTGGATPEQIAHTWRPRVPLEVGFQIVRWLSERGLLVPADEPAKDAA